jgi:hypothetical protein
MKWLQKRIRRFRNRRSSVRRGQAIAEYSLILVLLTIGSLITLYSFFPRFITAFQRYFDSFYLLLNLPIP